MSKPVKTRKAVSRTPDKRRVNRTFLWVLPRRLVQFREMRHMTQDQLAHEAGISRGNLNVIESGQARDIKLSTIEHLCEALGVSADALLGYNAKRLVRKARRHRAGDDIPGAPYICDDCHTLIAERALHPDGECMMNLSDAGETNARIGTVFGWATRTVGSILRVEREIRRHRKF